MGQFQRAILGSVSTACLLAVTPALAQTETPPGTLEEIVVTAMKREQSLQDIPAAISALSERALADRGIQDVAALQFAVPSLQSGKLVNSTAIAIRGVGLNQGSPGVAVNVDGVYQPRSSMGDLAQADLARVEVLRGPQGTLYGRNANGGAVNFISRTPSDALEGYVVGSYQNYDEYRLLGVMNVPLSSRVRSRLVVNYQDRNDGFVENVLNGPDLDKGTSLSGRLRVAADLTDELLLDLNLTALHDEGPFTYIILNSPPSAQAVAVNPFLSGAVIPSQPWRTSVNNRSDFNRSYGAAAATLTWQRGGVSLKSITSVSRLASEYHTDADGSNLDAFPQTNRNLSHTFTQELNLGYKTEALSLVAGAFFMNDRAPNYIRFDFNRGLGALPPGSALEIDHRRAQTKSVAVFADGTLDLTPKFRIYGGARYSVDKLESAQRGSLFIDLGPVTVENVTCALQDFDKKFESFTPRLGAQYDVSEGVRLYATVSKGFKAGGFNLSGCGQSFSPEKITAYEGGFKGRWLGNTLTLNGSAFYYDYTDLQLQQIVGLTSSITNAAAAEVSGVELEAAWAPDEHWTIGLNGALLKATYKDFVNLDSLNPSLGPQDVSGHYLNNAPKRSANLSVAYRTAPADWGQMTARADISYRSAIYFREFNLPLDTQGAYGLTNLALIWDSADERYRVRLFGENVFDQDYVVQMGSADNLGARYITYGTPRRVGAELRVNF